MKFEKTRRISAPADMLFAAASNRQNIDAWLPIQMHELLLMKRSRNPLAARYDVTDYLVTEHAHRRLWWDDGDGYAYTGWLQINEHNQASQVTLHVDAVGGTDYHDEIEQFLDQALTALEENFVTGNSRGVAPLRPAV